ncbi:hypothetical protein DXG03_005934 [Asterophora parasitica]|uniref:Uncharacterized protein n=1 Tax=Asterophora parasitica TaxID=117018 RepID=A0A9P7FZY4_9AGAR|nr:hypothetical protein DXG03_005934 [Asterophora parasitica]
MVPTASAEELVVGPLSIDSVVSGNRLPSHFTELKKALWKDELLQSWKEVLAELDAAVEKISTEGGAAIPRVSFAEMKAGLSEDQVKAIKAVGILVVTGGIPQEKYSFDVRLFCDLHRKLWDGSSRFKNMSPLIPPKSQVKFHKFLHLKSGAKITMAGFPADNIQIFEMYNSKGQVAARVHPAVIETQRFLLSLWHASDPNTQISLDNPICYFDRARIRHAGDTTFVLDPHIDNGSVERWEDPTYRQCYQEILDGGSAWRNHDFFDASPRLDAVQDMHDNSNQGSIFRAWQGWTSMSRTGPGEGTLRVLPMLAVAMPYIMLRPFFRLNAENNEWEVDLDNPDFPGSLLGGKQFLTPETHPHLRLDKTMVEIPTVDPGDQVYCASAFAYTSPWKG